MSCFAVMSAWEIEIIVRVCLFLAYFTDLRERGVTFRYSRGRMYLCICVICIRGGVPCSLLLRGELFFVILLFSRGGLSLFLIVVCGVVQCFRGEKSLDLIICEMKEENMIYILCFVLRRSVIVLFRSYV